MNNDRFRTSVLFVALASFLTLLSPSANAQEVTDGGGETDPSKDTEIETPPPPTIYDLVKVEEVYNLQYKNSADIVDKRRAGLHDIIIVEVDNLETLLKRAKCQEPYDQQPCREQEIALYLDGRIIKGLEPESGAPTLEEERPKATPAQDAQKSSKGMLRYHLQRTASSPENQEDNEEHWADLLGLGSNFRGWSLTRPTEVSVGLADEYPVPTEVKSGGKTGPFQLVRIRVWWLVVWGIFTFACLYLLWRLARDSDILRDRAPVLWGQSKPYSLSAFQAAWWFVLVTLSFIFIWLVTGQYDLSSTALVLVGIGLGTGLGSTVIDSNKRATGSDAQADSSELNLLLSDKEKIESELANLRSDPVAFGQKKVEYDAKIAEIKRKFPNAIGPAHTQFYLDILSDASGVSFHRFQMLAWTIVLGIFFVYAVLSRLAMPQFSETLLMLMGISAGTYLGFKIPENNNVATQPVAPPASGGDAASPPPPPPPEPPENG